ncbi:hypothetical protein CDL12_29364 [Handroanthus impetiginosus]|uniref:Uncharacterized protein n=1 Tax=Handroanthus impetiginosus TaxID=429701 RepID=A0A2G9FYM3_9LAMI|nr:hypothetical protein CDL12_29364 [Handroanthus impetiginosus]
MQDLEQLLSSYQDLPCPFTKEEVEILYHNVSLMDSLLRDSSGESYNREFMNEVSEERICDVARKAGHYVDFWAVECLEKLTTRRIIRVIDLIEDGASINEVTKKTGGRTLNEITEEIVSIKEELQKIHGDREVPDLEVTSSPGKLN